MDSKKLEVLRARYAEAAPGQSHNPEFRKIIEQVFAGTDRRPKPYEGVSTLLDAPLRADAVRDGSLASLDAALVGVPMDLGVTNRAGARLGPRAVREIERIGPYNHALKVAPRGECQAADIGDVPLRSRFSLDSSVEDIAAFYARIHKAAVRPLSVGGDHSVTYPILQGLGQDRPV